MFKKLEGDRAMILQGGVFKECDLYSFNGGLFAKASGGYIRLKADGTTSKEGVRLHHIEYDEPLFQDRFGRLSVECREGFKPVQIELDDGKVLLRIEG